MGSAKRFSAYKADHKKTAAVIALAGTASAVAPHALQPGFFEKMGTLASAATAAAKSVLYKDPL